MPIKENYLSQVWSQYDELSFLVYTDAEIAELVRVRIYLYKVPVCVFDSKFNQMWALPTEFRYSDSYRTK